MEFLLEIIGEFLIQVVGEALVELGMHSVVEPFRRPRNPWLAAIGYAIIGATFGGVSLLILPTHLVAASTWRRVNLLVTPLAVGLCMAALGSWRARRGQEILRIDRFIYGYLFALTLALVRYLWAA